MVEAVGMAGAVDGTDAVGEAVAMRGLRAGIVIRNRLALERGWMTARVGRVGDEGQAMFSGDDRGGEGGGG